MPGRVARAGRRLALQLWVASMVTWWLIGIQFSKLWWLVNERQLEWILFCYAWEVPAIGWTGAVLFPWLAFRRLGRRLAAPDERLAHVLAQYPLHVALMVLGTSTFGYFIGALQVDYFADLPTLELIKIIAQGPVLGAVLAIAAFLFAERAVQASAVALPPPAGARAITHSLYGKMLSLIVALTLCVSVPILLYTLAALQREEEVRRGAMLLAALDAAGPERSAESVAQEFGPHTYGFVVRRSNNFVIAGRGTGSVLYANDRRDFGVIQQRERGWFTSRDGQHKVVAFHHRPAALPDGDGAVLVLVSPFEDYAGSLASAGLTVAVLTLATLIVGLGLAAMLTQAVVGPVARLQRAAAQIASGNLDVETTAATGADEVAALAREFDRMAFRVRHDEQSLRTAFQELQRAQDKLVEAERLSAIGRLISGVAHELNNPLDAVLHYAEDMQADRGRPERDREALNAITDQARRSRTIVRDLLAFVRGRDHQREPTRAVDLVHRTRWAVQPTLFQLGARLETEAAEDLPPLSLDSVGIGQVLANLVINGAQAAGFGGVVRLSVRADDGGWRIVVDDNGPGVPEDLRARIFEPFFTTKPQGQGTGLGLAVSKGIIEQHGGTIGVEDRAAGEGGARLVVTLPAPASGRETPAAAVWQAVRERIPPTPPAGGHLRVLVVDDEVVLRTALRRFFERHGWVVEEAEDGAVALDLLRDCPLGHYAAVLTDLKMPRTTGAEVHDWLFENRPDLFRRLVVMTGDIAAVPVADFLARTPRPVLEKPFDLASLAEVLTKVTA